MEHYSMVDMKRTPEEQKTAETAMASPPSYPYGLCLSLDQDSLEKLGLEHCSLQVGDMIHFHAMSSVTAVSANDGAGGHSCRVELQITNMSAEDEDEETEDKKPKNVINKLYKTS